MIISTPPPTDSMKPKANQIAVLLIASLAFFTGGCASIVKGTTQAIPEFLPTFGESIQLTHSQFEVAATSTAKTSEILPGASPPPSVAEESPALPSTETKSFGGKSRTTDPDF